MLGGSLNSRLYTRCMARTTSDSLGRLSDPVRTHLENVAENLQLVADMGYCDVALAVRARPTGH